MSRHTWSGCAAAVPALVLPRPMSSRKSNSAMPKSADVRRCWHGRASRRKRCRARSAFRSTSACATGIPSILDTMQQIEADGDRAHGGDLSGAAIFQDERRSLLPPHAGGEERDRRTRRRSSGRRAFTRIRCWWKRSPNAWQLLAHGPPGAVHRAQPAGEDPGKRRPVRHRSQSHGARGGGASATARTGTSPIRARA